MIDSLLLFIAVFLSKPQVLNMFSLAAPSVLQLPPPSHSAAIEVLLEPSRYTEWDASEVLRYFTPDPKFGRKLRQQRAARPPHPAVRQAQNNWQDPIDSIGYQKSQGEAIYRRVHP